VFPGEGGRGRERKILNHLLFYKKGEISRLLMIQSPHSITATETCASITKQPLSSAKDAKIRTAIRSR
jgi:hypothetical protein